MKENEVQTYYDNYWNRDEASTWTPRIEPWSKSDFEGKFARFRGAKRILDIGCGDATTYHTQLLGIVDELYGIDVSRRAIERACSLGIKGHVGRFDAEPFPFPDNHFDGASCVEVLEHLFDPLYTAKEAYRVLKPGCCLVATVPNFGYIGDRLEAFFRARLRVSYYDHANPWAGAHIRFFSLREFKKLLRAAGFEIVRFIPHGSCSIFDSLWCIGHLVWLSIYLKQKLPYAVRLGFLEYLWPNVFAQHLCLVARKPE